MKGLSNVDIARLSLEWPHESTVTLRFDGYVYAIWNKSNGRRRYKYIHAEYPCKVFHCHSNLTTLTLPLEPAYRPNRCNYYMVRIERYKFLQSPHVQLEYVRPKYRHEFLDDEVEYPGNWKGIVEEHQVRWTGQIGTDVFIYQQ